MMDNINNNNTNSGAPVSGCLNTLSLNKAANLLGVNEINKFDYKSLNSIRKLAKTLGCNEYDLMKTFSNPGTGTLDMTASLSCMSESSIIDSRSFKSLTLNSAHISTLSSASLAKCDDLSKKQSDSLKSKNHKKSLLQKPNFTLDVLKKPDDQATNSAKFTKKSQSRSPIRDESLSEKTFKRTIVNKKLPSRVYMKAKQRQQEKNNLKSNSTNTMSPPTSPLYSKIKPQPVQEPPRETAQAPPTEQPQNSTLKLSQASYYNHIVNKSQKRDVTLYKDENLGFGFIAGSEKPLKIRFVTENGPGKNKLLNGDEILAINGEDVEFASRDHVISLIRNCKNVLKLVVKQPTPKSNNSLLLTEDKKAYKKSIQVKNKVRFLLDHNNVTDNENEEEEEDQHKENPTPKVTEPSEKEEKNQIDPIETKDESNKLDHIENPASLYSPLNDETNKNTLFRVLLENQSVKSFKYDSNTTVKDVLNCLKEKLCINYINHFGLVLKVNKNDSLISKLILLEETRCLCKITELFSGNSEDCQCLLRFIFIPTDYTALILNDLNSFNYLYEQSCNDVIYERYGSELKYEMILHLATLSILHDQIINKKTNLSFNLSVNSSYSSSSSFDANKLDENDAKLEKYLPKSILHSNLLKRKELKRLIAQNLEWFYEKNFLDENDIKLEYLKCMHELLQYSGRIFYVNLMDEMKEAFIIIGTNYGVATFIDFKSKTLLNLAKFECIENIRVSYHSNSLIRIDLDLFDTNNLDNEITSRTIRFGFLKDDYLQFLYLLQGYLRICVYPSKQRLCPIQEIKSTINIHQNLNVSVFLVKYPTAQTSCHTSASSSAIIINSNNTTLNNNSLLENDNDQELKRICTISKIKEEPTELDDSTSTESENEPQINETPIEQKPNKCDIFQLQTALKRQLHEELLDKVNLASLVQEPADSNTPAEEDEQLMCIKPSEEEAKTNLANISNITEEGHIIDYETFIPLNGPIIIQQSSINNDELSIFSSTRILSKPFRCLGANENFNSESLPLVESFQLINQNDLSEIKHLDNDYDYPSEKTPFRIQVDHDFFKKSINNEDKSDSEEVKSISSIEGSLKGLLINSLNYCEDSITTGLSSSTPLIHLYPRFESKSNNTEVTSSNVTFITNTSSNSNNEDENNDNNNEIDDNNSEKCSLLISNEKQYDDNTITNTNTSLITSLTVNKSCQAEPDQEVIFNYTPENKLVEEVEEEEEKKANEELDNQINIDNLNNTQNIMMMSLDKKKLKNYKTSSKINLNDLDVIDLTQISNKNIFATPPPPIQFSDDYNQNNDTNTNDNNNNNFNEFKLNEFEIESGIESDSSGGDHNQQQQQQLEQPNKQEEEGINNIESNCKNDELVIVNHNSTSSAITTAKPRKKEQQYLIKINNENDEDDSFKEKFSSKLFINFDSCYHESYSTTNNKTNNENSNDIINNNGIATIKQQQQQQHSSSSILNNSSDNCNSSSTTSTSSCGSSSNSSCNDPNINDLDTNLNSNLDKNTTTSISTILTGPTKNNNENTNTTTTTAINSDRIVYESKVKHFVNTYSNRNSTGGSSLSYRDYSPQYSKPNLQSHFNDSTLKANSIRSSLESGSRLKRSNSFVLNQPQNSASRNIEESKDKPKENTTQMTDSGLITSFNSLSSSSTASSSSSSPTILSSNISASSVSSTNTKTNTNGTVKSIARTYETILPNYVRPKLVHASTIPNSNQSVIKIINNNSNNNNSNNSLGNNRHSLSSQRDSRPVSHVITTPNDGRNRNNIINKRDEDKSTTFENENVNGYIIGRIQNESSNFKQIQQALESVFNPNGGIKTSTNIRKQPNRPPVVKINIPKSVNQNNELILSGLSNGSNSASEIKKGIPSPVPAAPAPSPSSVKSDSTEPKQKSSFQRVFNRLVETGKSKLPNLSSSSSSTIGSNKSSINEATRSSATLCSEDYNYELINGYEASDVKVVATKKRSLSQKIISPSTTNSTDLFKSKELETATNPKQGSNKLVNKIKFGRKSYSVSSSLPSRNFKVVDDIKSLFDKFSSSSSASSAAGSPLHFKNNIAQKSAPAKPTPSPSPPPIVTPSQSISSAMYLVEPPPLPIRSHSLTENDSYNIKKSDTDELKNVPVNKNIANNGSVVKLKTSQSFHSDTELTRRSKSNEKNESFMVIKNSNQPVKLTTFKSSIPSSTVINKSSTIGPSFNIQTTQRPSSMFITQNIENKSKESPVLSLRMKPEYSESPETPRKGALKKLGIRDSSSSLSLKSPLKVRWKDMIEISNIIDDGYDDEDENTDLDQLDPNVNDIDCSDSDDDDEDDENSDSSQEDYDDSDYKLNKLLKKIKAKAEKTEDLKPKAESTETPAVIDDLSSDIIITSEKKNYTRKYEGKREQFNLKPLHSTGKEFEKEMLERIEKLTNIKNKVFVEEESNKFYDEIHADLDSTLFELHSTIEHVRVSSMLTLSNDPNNNESKDEQNSEIMRFMNKRVEDKVNDVASICREFVNNSKSMISSALVSENEVKPHVRNAMNSLSSLVVECFQTSYHHMYKNVKLDETRQLLIQILNLLNTFRTTLNITYLAASKQLNDANMNLLMKQATSLANEISLLIKHFKLLF